MASARCICLLPAASTKLDELHLKISGFFKDSQPLFADVQAAAGNTGQPLLRFRVQHSRLLQLVRL